MQNRVLGLWLFLVLSGGASVVCAESAPGFPWSEKGLWGLRTVGGRWIVPPVYKGVEEFCGGYAAVCRVVLDQSDAASNGVKWGFVDTRGTLVIDTRFDEVRAFSSGVAWVKLGRLWGLIDGSGAWRIRPTYKDVSPFSEGLALVWAGGHFGWVDTSGTWVLKPEWDGGGEFSGGQAPFKKNGLWGYLDRKGSVTIAPTFNKAGSFAGGVARVKKGKLWGLIRADGAWVVLPCWTEVDPCTEGLWPVKKEGLWGFVDPMGRVAVPLAFKRVHAFRAGLAAAQDRRTELWGFIDTSGCWVLAPLYSKAGDFFDTVAKVRIQDRWTWVTRDGTEIGGSL